MEVMQTDGRKHPLARCEECPWREDGKYVPALFPSVSAKIAVVGEAPGSYEARTGIPFTGPSGELLDRVIEHHGYKRKELALINTVSCRPEGPTQKPPKQAIACCSARLDDDLRRANAPVILALGGTSAQAILDDSRPISKLRIGLPRDSRYGPVIPTWHPAFCLRTPDAFPSFVRDTGKLNGSLIEPWTPPSYVVFENPDLALVAIRRLLAVKKIVIDIEAAFDKDIDDAHPEEYELLCVGVGYAKGQAVVFGPRVFKDEACLEAFGELIQTVPVSTWHGKFDMLGLSPKFGIQKIFEDGMLKSYIVDERPRQHALKQRVVEDLGAPRYDEEIAEYVKGKEGSFAKIPKELLYKYNAYDCGATWDEIEYLDLQMDEKQHELHKFLIEATNELMHIEMSPLCFDMDYNASLAMTYSSKLEKSELEIAQFCGYDLNPRSPMQILQWFALQGMDIPTTERAFLEKLLDECDDRVVEFIELLLENRGLAKTFGTYIKGLRKKARDGLMFTTFSLHSTTSGRLASRKPNMQNIKRDKEIRNQFTASPGRILVQNDYSQVEGRTICDLSRDGFLQASFSDPDIDIFNNMCDNIWGRGAWNKENRVSIKSIFYGYSYGRKAKSIARELKKPVEYAQNLMEEFKQLIPGVVAWQAAIRKQVLDEQFLTTPFGRRRSFHLITNDNMEDVINEALSYQPQSIASDICLRAAVRLRSLLKDKFDADIKLLIHDAIVAECLPEFREEVAEMMRFEMVRSGQEYTNFVPFAVESTYGFRLGEL
jgi:uracil-DNA glycosylase family 4